MTTKRFIGCLMLVVPFAILFGVVTPLVGLFSTITIITAVLILFVWIWAATGLIA